MPERVLVIGGTRGTGALIVARLVGEGCRVRALGRSAGASEGGTREAGHGGLAPAVERVAADITRPESLAGALAGVDHLIFAAGVTGRRAGEAQVRAITYDGLRNTLSAAREVQFSGRFLYLSSIGVTGSSTAAAALVNLLKRNVWHWRRQAEAELRASELDYTIVRAGILSNAPGERKIMIGQGSYPLAPQSRVSRADVAEVCVRALRHPATRRTTFAVVGATRCAGTRPLTEEWDMLFGRLLPDDGVMT